MNVIWNRDAFERLKIALEEAQGVRAERFPFDPNPPKKWAALKFSAIPVKASFLIFTIREAQQKIGELQAEFAAPDQPARPYLEGREGQ